MGTLESSLLNIPDPSPRPVLAVGHTLPIPHSIVIALIDLWIGMGWECAEINGKVRAYLQPIMLSANALAKTLLAQPTELTLPAMLIKVKTPLMPIQLGGEPVLDVNSWQVDIDAQGYSLSAYNEQKETVGFVVTEGHMKNAFPLLRKLSTPL